MFLGIILWIYYINVCRLCINQPVNNFLRIKTQTGGSKFCFAAVWEQQPMQCLLLQLYAVCCRISRLQTALPARPGMLRLYNSGYIVSNYYKKE